MHLKWTDDSGDDLHRPCDDYCIFRIFYHIYILLWYTAAERQQVQKFFSESELTERPVVRVWTSQEALISAISISV